MCGSFLVVVFEQKAAIPGQTNFSLGLAKLIFLVLILEFEVFLEGNLVELLAQAVCSEPVSSHRV